MEKSSVESIKHNGVVIAQVIYNTFQKEGIEFFSSKDYPLQLGYMNRQKNYKISPHIHNPVKRNTVGTQEVLIVKSGIIRIDFYSHEQEYLESRNVSQGDIVLLIEAGHGIEFITKAEIVEVKNGPYDSEANDKQRFKERARSK